MSERVNIISGFYGQIEEDKRLEKSRHGQLEYRTTMEYVHRYAKKGDKILEVGAGTGRYSIALAKEGFDVTAVELVESNLDVLKKNSEGVANIEAYQGDALNLDRFKDGEFDVTLVFGPMYHLYEKADVLKAIDEAMRVTKKGGIVLFAFLSVYAILFDNYLNDRMVAGIEENFDKDYKIRHFEEQLFTGYDIVEFENLFEKRNVEHLSTVAVDSVMELVSNNTDFASLTDEGFEAFVKYHLATCETRELLGCSSHLLYICKTK